MSRNTNDVGLLVSLGCHSSLRRGYDDNTLHFCKFKPSSSYLHRRLLECSFLRIAKDYIQHLPTSMSFLAGAECSTAGNPLSQFTKHVQDDKSLQRDRLVGRSPGGLQESFRGPANGSGQDEVTCLCTQT